METLIGLRTIGGFVAKKIWKRLHPKYTEEELMQMIGETGEEFEKCTGEGDYWGAFIARNKCASYQLKVLKINYERDMRNVKRRVEHVRRKAKAQKKKRKARKGKKRVTSVQPPLRGYE